MYIFIQLKLIFHSLYFTHFKSELNTYGEAIQSYTLKFP